MVSRAKRPSEQIISIAGQDERALVVTGNPNVGKSVIFHWLTGRYATVSNYPGTTVTVTRGRCRIDNKKMPVYDTPGINSLMANSDDEMVTRRILLGGAKRTVLQVADAKHLDRSLALTIELAEGDIPIVLDLNMADEARERRIVIDTEALAKRLKVNVVPTIATQRWGFERLSRSLTKPSVPALYVTYPQPIEDVLEQLEGALPLSIPGRRAWALLWMADDADARAQFERALDKSAFQRLSSLVDELRQRIKHPIGAIIAESRLRKARAIAEEVISREPQPKRPWLNRLADVALHPFWGSAIALGVLWVVYLLVGYFGAQICVDFLENTVFNRFINPAATWLVTAFLPVASLQDLLVGEYGLVTMALTYSVAIILPIVGMFFLCFGFLEDVGYLPRLAVLADRTCRLVGLNGKAVLPLVLGLGCDTMATMTARTLETKRDQIIVTLLLALAVPCSAQLGVILAMLAALPPLALWIWLAVILISFISAGQMAMRLIGGETSPFLYELPPLRRPKFSNVAVKTLGRVEWYLREAVPLFFLGTFVLFILDRTGSLSAIERGLSPLIVYWLGLPAKATEAFLVGFLRRDFGAAGLFALERNGLLDPTQTLVSLVTITLFVPCFAQYLMMVKERGWKMATSISALVFGYAFFAGGVLRWALQILNINW